MVRPAQDRDLAVVKRAPSPPILVVAAVLSACLALVACRASHPGLERAAEAPSTAPSTSVPPATSRPVTTTVPAAPTTTADPCPPPFARVQPEPDRPDYRLQITADPVGGLVEGTEDIAFTPDLPVDSIVLRLWANGPRPAAAGTRIVITAVSEQGTPRRAEQPDPTTAVIPLGRTVAPGTRLHLVVTWTLQVEGPVNDRISRQQDSLRLGSFVPLLAWQPGIGWATDPPTSGFAEAATSPTANWHYSVAVPAGFSVTATGSIAADGTYVAQAVRDIAVAVGRFTVISVTTHAPNPVLVTVAVHDQVDEASRYLDQIVRDLADLSARFGPYPWPAYTVSITPDLSGGIEFPMHVLQGPGTDDRTTPHELAHMWFYGLVGNNQAEHPYLDEGLATYAEGRVLGTLDSMQSRTIPVDGRGRAGEPMTYWEHRASSYYRSVYVQTAAALARLGDLDRVDCALARYVDENAYTIAEPDDLARALDEVFTDWGPTLAAAGLP